MQSWAQMGLKESLRVVWLVPFSRAILKTMLYLKAGAHTQQTSRKEMWEGAGGRDSTKGVALSFKASPQFHLPPLSVPCKPLIPWFYIQTFANAASKPCPAAPPPSLKKRPVVACGFPPGGCWVWAPKDRALSLHIGSGYGTKLLSSVLLGPHQAARHGTKSLGAQQRPGDRLMDGPPLPARGHSCRLWPRPAIWLPEVYVSLLSQQQWVRAKMAGVRGSTAGPGKAVRVWGPRGRHGEEHLHGGRWVVRA